MRQDLSPLTIAVCAGVPRGGEPAARPERNHAARHGRSLSACAGHSADRCREWARK